MANIKFIERSHQYISEKGELTSVSKFTERFKEKVDWNMIAQRLALKQTKAGTPTTRQDILKKWERKRNISAEIGTLQHSIEEQDLLRKCTHEFYGVDCGVQSCLYGEGGVKHSLPIHQLTNNTVYPELMIYDMDYMICGQSDKVIIADNRIHIWDYKTDAEITFTGFSNKWVKARKFLPPIDHLDDCNGNLYSIKMSMYMYLLWKANKGRFKPGEIIIEHVALKRDAEDDNIPIIENGKPVVLKTEQIRLPYRKKEVISMLKTI